MINDSDRADGAALGTVARGVCCPAEFADASGPIRPAPGVR
jgi:hypothetical protein